MYLSGKNRVEQHRVSVTADKTGVRVAMYALMYCVCIPIPTLMNITAMPTSICVLMCNSKMAAESILAYQSDILLPD